MYDAKFEVDEQNGNQEYLPFQARQRARHKADKHVNRNARRHRKNTRMGRTRQDRNCRWQESRNEANIRPKHEERRHTLHWEAKEEEAAVRARPMSATPSTLYLLLLQFVARLAKAASVTAHQRERATKKWALLSDWRG